MRDAIVVGSGPNGLAAAIVLARAGRSVSLLEAEETLGGGCRSAELTLPGFVHDVCAAVHPLAAASPFMRSVPLARHGVEWIHSPAALAHPFDDGTAALLLFGRVDETAAGLGEDADAVPAPDGSARGARRSCCSKSCSHRSGFLAARARWRGSRPGRHCRRASSRGEPFAARRHVVSSRVSPRTRCCRSPGSRPRRTGSCSECSRTRSAGRSPGAGRSGSRTVSSPTSSRSAARSSRADVVVEALS